MADQMIRKKLKKSKADRRRRQLAKDEETYNTYVITFRNSLGPKKHLDDEDLPEDYHTYVGMYENHILTHTRAIAIDFTNEEGNISTLIYFEFKSYGNIGEMKVVLSKLDYKKWCAVNRETCDGKRLSPKDLKDYKCEDCETRGLRCTKSHDIHFNIEDYEVIPAFDIKDARLIRHPEHTYKMIVIDGRKLSPDCKLYKDVTSESIDYYLEDDDWEETMNKYEYNGYLNEYKLHEENTEIEDALAEARRVFMLAQAQMAKKQ